MAELKPQTTMAEIQPMLHTQDIEALRDFYESLGFIEERMYAPDGTLNWMRLQFHGASIMLQSNERAEANRATNDVELYFACEEIDGIYSNWKRRGIDVTPPKTAFYGYKQMYVRDPDGRRICFESVVQRS